MEGNDQGVGFDTFRLVLFVILLVSLLSPGNHGQSSNLRETEEQKRMKKEKMSLENMLDADMAFAKHEGVKYAYNISGTYTGSWRWDENNVTLRANNVSLNVQQVLRRKALNRSIDVSEGTLSLQLYDRGPFKRNMHYVFVDNILYGREDASKSYELGLSDEIAHWLRQDLSYVPKDKTIMICAHSQMFKKYSSFSTRNRNYAVYRDELLKFRNVYSWAGHNHHTYIYNYNRSEQMPIENLTAVTVTRSTGSLRLNKHLNNDGTPQGYMIVDVDGDDVSWYYHSCGKDRSHQMRLYSPVRTGSDYVLANVWTWDDAWGPVEWWENGVKMGEMEPCEEFDPDYVDLYATVTNKTTRKYCQPAKSFHMFCIKPSPGVKAGEVRVTDRFGTTYTEHVSW